MKTPLNQKGVGHLIALLLILVVAAVGFVGYRVMNSDKTSTSGVSSKTKEVTVPSAISSKADINKASAALDSTSIDSDVNPSQLDSDLNSL